MHPPAMPTKESLLLYGTPLHRHVVVCAKPTTGPDQTLYRQMSLRCRNSTSSLNYHQVATNSAQGYANLVVSSTSWLTAVPATDHPILASCSKVAIAEPPLPSHILSKLHAPSARNRSSLFDTSILAPHVTHDPPLPSPCIPDCGRRPSITAYGLHLCNCTDPAPPVLQVLRGTVSCTTPAACTRHPQTQSLKVGSGLEVAFCCVCFLPSLSMLKQLHCYSVSAASRSESSPYRRGTSTQTGRPAPMPATVLQAAPLAPSSWSSLR